MLKQLTVFALAASALYAQSAVHQVATPDQALAALKAGNARFVGSSSMPKPTDIDRASLAAGQAPFAAILSCADSRVPPEQLFDFGPGELFVARVAGNSSEPTTLGSLEYAVQHLHSKLIVVMGHSDCGAVKASMMPPKDQAKLAKLIQHFVSLVHPGKAHNLHDGTVNNVRYQMSLVEKDPVVHSLVMAHKVKVVGAYYDIGTGKVTFL